jgi:protein-disulfide isomerase
MQSFGRFLGWCAVTAAISCVAIAAQIASPGKPVPPTINKTFLSDYLRYAEGFTPSVTIAADDPQPTIFTGFYKVLVHLKAGKNEAVRTYYLTQDGQKLVAAPLFDLHRSPFIANLDSLKEEGAPAFGPANAPVKIYVFSDFECPYCQEEAKVLRQGIDKAHASQIRVVFKNFPLDSIHPWAPAGAVAGVCIARQGADKFWSFHDWIYQHQSDINAGNLHDKVLEFAKEQSINSQELSSCMSSSSAANEVDKTVAEGRNLGLVQTPTLFVNGRMVAGALPASQINLLIQMEIDHQATQASSAEKAGESCCGSPIPTMTRH